MPTTLRQGLGVAAASLVAVAAWADGRTVVKPGWNMFSTQQDVEVGQQVSVDAERQLVLLRDSRVDNYVDALGSKLAAKATGEKYPYRFTVVDDRSINAFALPGGPVYINRGVIEAADNEAQLAGVMAHEIAHVALRHGTNQASKASAAQMPLAILGGMLSSSSTRAAIANLGAGFAVNSILLKYSRTAESQADVMATQLLFDAGYNQRAMAQFFTKLETGQGGGAEFFSNHPSPENRIARVNQEVTALGGVRRNATVNSRAFDDVKRRVLSMPAPPAQGQLQAGTGTPSAPPLPSTRYVTVENGLLRLSHPDDWQTNGQGDAMTITPRGGLVDDGDGGQAMVYGVIVNLFEPPSTGSAYSRTLQGPGSRSVTRNAETRLNELTNQLIQELRLSNRSMRVVREPEAIRVDGDLALSTYLGNQLASGDRETDWLVTVQRPDGLLFIVFTAPEREFDRYEETFSQMLRSVRVVR